MGSNVKLSKMVGDMFKIVDSAYGKTGVKILHVSKAGSVHSIRELEVVTLLTLDNTKDYETGDNEDIVATDSQKNTVYVLAKKFGITTPEEFGLVLVTHFISKYPWVTAAKAQITAHPWERITDRAGQQHSHAFISSPSMTRVAEVVMTRGSRPSITAGIRNLRVLKTTQSAFVKFVDDEFRTLPDMDDRVFSTIVTADWTYSTIRQLDFDAAFATARDIVLDVFAGPAGKGVFSPSVQNSQHLTQRQILGAIPQVESVTIAMPNVHYFGYDFSKFKKLPELTGECSGEVYNPVDKPSGLITSTLARENIQSKL